MREDTFIRLIAPALALLLFVGAALAQTQIKLRAGAHDGFGRVVFDLPGRLAHKAVISGQVLQIDFEQPIAVGLEPVRRHLFRYVGEAKLENDGRRISVSLLKPVTLREQWIENALVVDLVDVKADGGLNRPRVSVRSGDHSDYSRLVFDWRRHTDYRVQQDGRSVAVTFGADARLDVAAIAADRPDRLAGIELLTPDNGSAVRLSVANDARIRHFRSGTKVVVDILGKPPGDSRQAVETNAGTAKSKPKPSASKPATAPVPAAKAPRSLLASSDEKEAANDAGDGKPAKSEGSAKPGAPQSATANAASVESSDTAKDEAKAKPAPRRFSSRSDGLELAVDRSGETIFLSFAWPEPVPAAVFERAGYLWLVFDQPAEPDLDALRPSDGIVRAQQIRDSRATILRLKTRDDLFPSIRRKGAIWILSLSDRSGGAKSSVPAVSQPNAEGGARVFLPVSDTGKRLAIYDPEVGDELLVVPLLGDGVGVAVAQRFVQFELLASLQGLAFRPNADDVIVRPLRNGVSIGADSGLLLSSQDSKRRTNDAQPYRSSLKSPITHFIAWQGGRGANFGARKQELQQIQAKSPAAGRNVARWEMAKFYIGHGLAAETWALLQLIEKDDAGAAQNPQYRAVRGITKLLMNRLDEARDDLMHADLKLYPDVALWRGDLLLRLGDAEEARAQFALGSGILPVLPSKLRERILRQWAVAAVEAGDDPGFHQAEDELKRLPPNKRIQTTLSYLNGRIAAREGDDEAALAAYDEAIAADFRPFRARAAFERVNSALKSGKIDPAQAVERLDSLRFAWRGDDFELDVLNRIVDIELELDRYASALGHLREAISYFPESEATKAMARQMNEIFVDLFLEGKADDMPPVSALALYYEFQELTPFRSHGDKMI